MDHITRRVRICRLIERINRDKEYAEKLGLVDVSKYEKTKIKGEKKNEEINR